ncbi:hypothetical protein LST1_16720 [Neisseria elongata]|nr:hypothetical protein LST1_16720 [Neisseria elongata]
MFASRVVQVYLGSTTVSAKYNGLSLIQFKVITMNITAASNLAGNTAVFLNIVF